MPTSSLPPFHHLLLHFLLCLLSTLLSSLLPLPSLLLHSLHSYIHPDSVPSASSIPIRRPSAAAAADPPKRRSKSKTLSSFDESAAQLFRIRLSDSHLRSRLLFQTYRLSFLLSSVALSNLALNLLFLRPDPLSSAALPSLAALAAFSYLLLALLSLLSEKSAFKRSDLHFSILFSFLGFLSSLLILLPFSPAIFDFKIPAAAAAIAGILAGALYTPATRAARSFWLGTDQLRWNLSLVSCGPFARFLLYVTVLLNVLTPLLWVNPMAVAVEVLKKWRTGALAASAVLQLVVLRPNLQMYLNEAVLSWYQRLHASRVPDLDYGRAKVFLHNHYLCLVATQFFVPPVLVLLLLGLSQIRGNLFSGILFVGGLEDWSGAVKEVALFLAWWIVFVWGVVVMASLALYRCGILFIS